MVAILPTRLIEHSLLKYIVIIKEKFNLMTPWISIIHQLAKF